MTTDHDIIVIGSGFGGAVAASRLVEAGHRVTLLERGPWRDSVPVRSMGISRRVPFPQGPGALKRLVRTLRNALLPGGGITLNRDGLFEIHLGRGLNVVCSSSVGGGSHVYAGLNVRPPDAHYWDGILPPLSATAMEARYARVLDRMGSRAAMADDQLPHTLGERFGDSDVIDARGADYELAMGFLFPETPGQPRRVTTDDGVERYTMSPGEDGNLGSVKGGKTSVDFAFLARALRQGLTVVDQCEVETIRRGADSGYTVEVMQHADKRRATLTATSVIVAAGTLNTLRLLLHSVAAGGLARMPQLGRRFGGNGDFFGYWNLADDTRDLSASMPAHGPLRVHDADALGPGRAWPLMAEGALPSPTALTVPRFLANKLTSGTFVAGMGADAQDGNVTYRNGRLRIHYTPATSEIFARIKDAFRYIGQRTGKRIYHFDTPITVHPTGGACIGPDAEHGVVDGYGEVFGHPGLYVADAAALPKPVAGPPSMTIAAWADHVAGSIIERRRAAPRRSAPPDRVSTDN